MVILHPCSIRVHCAPDVNKTFSCICFPSSRPAMCFLTVLRRKRSHQMPKIGAALAKRAELKGSSRLGSRCDCVCGKWSAELPRRLLALCLADSTLRSHFITTTLRYLPTPPAPPSLYRDNQLAGLQPVCILLLFFLLCFCFTLRWEPHYCYSRSHVPALHAAPLWNVINEKVGKALV